MDKLNITTEVAEAFGYRDRIRGIEAGHRLPRGHIRRAYRRGWTDADDFKTEVMVEFYLNNYWLLSGARPPIEHSEAAHVDL